MEVVEQTNSRVVLKSAISRASIWSGGLTTIIAAILFANLISVKGNSYFYHRLLPAVLLLYGLFCIVTLRISTLSLDKVAGTVTRRNSYLFGIISRTRSMELANLGQFSIRHISTYKWNPAAMWFTFHSNNAKLIFKSDRLHFGEGVNRYDARNSQEEALGNFVAQFISLPVTLNDKMIDSKNLKTRMSAVILLLVAGGAFALASTWIYYHLVKHP